MENFEVFSGKELLFSYEGDMRGFIFWLFNGRCVTCRRSASEINHIIPKGRGSSFKDDWKNQVTQCTFCHSEYHRDGVTALKIRHLQETRRLFLIALGREKFI